MRQQRNVSRQRTVLIAVLVCMGIASTIVLGAVQISLRQRQQTRQELQMEQTKWLLDAGIGTAISRLQAQPAYNGETISVTPALEKYPDASIEITVIRSGQPDDQVSLKVTARLSGAEKQSPTTQRSKEILVEPANQQKN